MAAAFIAYAGLALLIAIFIRAISVDLVPGVRFAQEVGPIVAIAGLSILAASFWATGSRRLNVLRALGAGNSGYLPLDNLLSMLRVVVWPAARLSEWSFGFAKSQVRGQADEYIRGLARVLADRCGEAALVEAYQHALAERAPEDESERDELLDKAIGSKTSPRWREHYPILLAHAFISFAGCPAAERLARKCLG